MESNFSKREKEIYKKVFNRGYFEALNGYFSKEFSKEMGKDYGIIPNTKRFNVFKAMNTDIRRYEGIKRYND